MARAAVALLSAALSVAAAAAAAVDSVGPVPAGAGTAAPASPMHDEKSAKWMESLRRDLMRDNYDYQRHGGPRRSGRSGDDESDDPDDDKLYASYEDRKRPVTSQPARAVPEIPEHTERVSQRARDRSSLHSPVSEAQEDYADAMPMPGPKQSHGYPGSGKPANEAHEEYADAMPMQGPKYANPFHGYPGPGKLEDEAQEDYADAMPMPGPKQSNGYPGPGKPANEAHEEYADAMPMQGPKHANPFHGYPGPGKLEDEAQEDYADAMPMARRKQPKPSQGSRKPVNAAQEEYAEAMRMHGPKHGYPVWDTQTKDASESYPGRARERPELHGYSTSRAVTELGADCPPAALLHDNGISRRDLYGPGPQGHTDNGSLTDQEFEARRRDFLDRLYELEDELSPVYVTRPESESRRGVAAGARGREAYQRAALPGGQAGGGGGGGGGGGRGRSRDAPAPLRPPRRGRGGRHHTPREPRRYVNSNNGKEHGVMSFVDPRDGIRRYKVHTNDGKISNNFDMGPMWDEDGLYDPPAAPHSDGEDADRYDRPPNKGNKAPSRDGTPPSKGNISPNRDARPPNKGNIAPNRVGKPPNKVIYPNRVGRPPNKVIYSNGVGRPPTKGNMSPNRDGRPPNKGNVTPNRVSKPPNKGNSRSPNRDGRPRNKGNRSPNINNRPPTRGITPKRNLRHGGDMPLTSHLAPPVVDGDQEPQEQEQEIYKDVDDPNTKYSDVWQGVGSSGERRSGRRRMQPEYSEPHRPEATTTMGYPEMHASRRNAELLKENTITATTCACQQNTTHVEDAKA